MPVDDILGLYRVGVRFHMHFDDNKKIEVLFGEIGTPEGKDRPPKCYSGSTRRPRAAL
ncbi:hypothetical protein QTH97_33660 [Variovorax sp. J22R24]|uniref:hypothetical protein n=1 Tax=Variovorax gracilis TaxID=3053502 RepID=UPI0025749943|nr:hypothetical protein [Variovorax sp. J22R24]MDM0109900.1 hypothetical protein [Variovorax sp. J22R24]